MGRLKNWQQICPLLTVRYKKLLDDYDYSTNDNNNNSSGESLAVVPKLPDYLAYPCCECGHIQKLKAEELNTIVGNAFRMAYDAQLQKSSSSFNDLINAQLEAQLAESKRHETKVWARQASLTSRHRGSVTSDLEMKTVSSSDEDHTNGNLDRITTRVPSSISSSSSTSSSSHGTNDVSQVTSQRHIAELGSVNIRDSVPPPPPTPPSDESNSPTELNSYRRLLDKPPLIKRLTMGCGSDEELCPLVKKGCPRSTLAGYVNEVVTDSEARSSCSRSSSSCTRREDGASTSRTSIPSTPSPPLPQRQDSLSLIQSADAGELRVAPWFQAGIPREIALEVLSEEPVGAFMVRESTTKPGCYALSLRVPRDFHVSGIAHYLILRSTTGYKIKGFKKEFSTLTSLITHHSVMPELLPCPLSLSRYNPTFSKSDSSRDFVEIGDPDYNTLNDFRRMMTDLNVS